MAGRFMARDQGGQFLDGIRGHFRGRTITEVEFSADGERVTTILRLSNGQRHAFNDEELHPETLREQFGGLFRELTATHPT